MIRTAVKYIAIGFLLIVYINRGLFVASVEPENSCRGEINSVFEWIIEFVTGQSNNIDEDGDSPETYNSVKIVQPCISQQFSQLLDLWNKFPVKTEKKFLPTNEIIPLLSVLRQIDHPPKS